MEVSYNGAPYSGQEVMLMIVRTMDEKWQHHKWLLIVTVLGLPSL